MNDDEADEPIIPTLCDECSGKLTSGENWLGAMKLDGSFECMICHQLCCSHLKHPGGFEMCQSCM